MDIEMMEKIREILSEYTDYPKEEMNENTALEADLGFSSLDVMSVVMAFEDKFGIEIPDREIKDLLTVGHIAEYLKKYCTL